jgi:hypothetical protein
VHGISDHDLLFSKTQAVESSAVAKQQAKEYATAILSLMMIFQGPAPQLTGTSTLFGLAGLRDISRITTRTGRTTTQQTTGGEELIPSRREPATKPPEAMTTMVRRSRLRQEREPTTARRWGRARWPRINDGSKERRKPWEERPLPRQGAGRVNRLPTRPSTPSPRRLPSTRA